MDHQSCRHLALEAMQKWLVGATIGFALTLILVYVPLYAFFIHPNPTYSEPVVGGYSLMPAPEELNKSIGLSPVRLLQEFGEDPNLVWTPGSLAICRILVLMSWLVLSLWYAVGVSAFVAIQYRKFT